MLDCLLLVPQIDTWEVADLVDVAKKPPVPLIVVLDNVWRCEDSVFDVGEIYRTVTALHFH